MRSHTASGRIVHAIVACAALALAPAAHANADDPVYKLPVPEYFNLSFWISLFLTAAAVLVAFYRTGLSAVALLGSCVVAGFTVGICSFQLGLQDGLPLAFYTGLAGSVMSYAVGRVWWRSAKRKRARVGTIILLLVCAAAILAPALAAVRLLIDHWALR